MNQETIEKGYVIQLYQYARRYRYNNEGCLKFFNSLIDQREEQGIEKYTLESDFLTFGDFDLLQIIKVDSFRKYHDVSELAKDWLGKRQSVLLYDLSCQELPVRIFYNEDSRLWKKSDGSVIQSDFFCLSMLSITNEIVEKTEDISTLLRILRSQILTIVGKLNDAGVCSLECEVFGTFGTSELGIVWLSDQYVDVLQVIDYIKHIRIIGGQNFDKAQEGCPAFFNSFSTIAIKEETDCSAVRGSALVQIAVHDAMKEHDDFRKFADEIAGSEQGHILYSVGEYDLVIEVSAKRAIELIQRDGMLSLGRRERETGKFDMTETRPFLRSNTRLLYNEEQTAHLKRKLDELHKEGFFHVEWQGNWKAFTRYFEWEELKRSSKILPQNRIDINNADYYQLIRQELKLHVSSSAGAVDTLDLLYADYNSAVSTAYNAMWVSDLHRQFKAVLHAISLLISSTGSERLEWSWDRYRDLTNVFKQQIYHLMQSSRMFFEIPSCHLRATGQYDFLMHAYYGITKRILEIIYLMQENDAQSELVPLITVNTVPQVKSQLYFELGNDDIRVINLDIPNSIIFDFRRGTWYLTHELFHYAVPKRREERNYYMAVFLLALIFKKQFLYVSRELLSARADGTTDEKVLKAVRRLSGDGEEKSEIKKTAELYGKLDELLLSYVEDRFQEDIRPLIEKENHADDLSSSYQRAVYEFAQGSDSDRFFQGLFAGLFPVLCEYLQDMDDGQADEDTLNRIKDRIQYCQRNTEYVELFVRSDSAHRVYNNKLAQNTWSAVREACSDIAMVSLNGLDVVDYMLFCIQAWTDSNNDKKEVLRKMKQREAQPEWLRFAITAEYFLIKSRAGWCDYADEFYIILSDEAENKFLKQYLWLYARKSMMNRWKEEYIRVYQDAGEWLNFFSGCKRYFQKNYAIYFDGILKHILSDFDVNHRIHLLQKRKGSDYARQLEKLQREFRDQVYLPYSHLQQEMPFDDTAPCPENVDAVQMEDYNRRYKARRFERDIAVAHYFRNQKSLHELKELNRKIQETIRKEPFVMPEKEGGHGLKHGSFADTHDWKFHVHSLTELLFYIRYCYDRLNETADQPHYHIGQSQNTTIWFRGHTSEGYKLVPTVMRCYKGSKMEQYPSLRNYQQSNFEGFKFRADGAPEMPTGLRFTQSDYIAMMQHYSVHTNFLDWTENAYISLYLALKYFYDEKIKMGDQKWRNVTLSIFHPGVYNHIRRDSLDNIRVSVNEDNRIAPCIKKVMQEANQFASLVPNLSTRKNEDYFEMFLLGDPCADTFHMKMSPAAQKEYAQLCRNDYQDLFMPAAVLTSRLNPRIRTQCGCFVAYNLYTPPADAALGDDSVDSLFDYISLEEIQERKKEEAIFLYQITIDKECCMEVVRWLKALGVSRENVYPELSEKGHYFL